VPGSFIAQGQAVTLSPGARQVAPEWLNPYIVGHYRLEIANDDLGGTSSLPRCRRSAAQYRLVRSHPLPTTPVSGQPCGAAL
jgi:hypothetical protein